MDSFGQSHTGLLAHSHCTLFKLDRDLDLALINYTILQNECGYFFMATILFL